MAEHLIEFFFFKGKDYFSFWELFAFTLCFRNVLFLFHFHRKTYLQRNPYFHLEMSETGKFVSFFFLKRTEIFSSFCLENGDFSMFPAESLLCLVEQPQGWDNPVFPSVPLQTLLEENSVPCSLPSCCCEF